MLQSRLQEMNDERLVTISELAQRREERQSASRDIQQLRDNIQNLETKLAESYTEVLKSKDVVTQYEIEKELRSRCEVREEAERRERIAISAQMLATQSECEHNLRDIEQRTSLTIQNLKDLLATVTTQREAALTEARRQAELVLGLESETLELRRALGNASINHDSAEIGNMTAEIGKLTGELEILRKRMRDINDRKVSFVLFRL